MPELNELLEPIDPRSPSLASWKPDPEQAALLQRFLRQAPTQMPAPPPQPPAPAPQKPGPSLAELIKGWPGNVDIDPYLRDLPIRLNRGLKGLIGQYQRKQSGERQ